ncbi:MAG: PsiF family protein [Polaromonas sp.]
MKILLPLIAVGFAFSMSLSPVAHAQDAPAKTAQQSRMAACNKDAEGKKGDERKAFMKECLSAKKEMTQQVKMKTCNADAKGKKGDERKAFMKECLSK